MSLGQCKKVLLIRLVVSIAWLLCLSDGHHLPSRLETRTKEFEWSASHECLIILGEMEVNRYNVLLILITLKTNQWTVLRN